MNLQEVDTIGIIGAGTMGLGISQVAAIAGFNVIIHDSSEKALENFEKKLMQQLQKGVDKGKLTSEEMGSALGKVTICNKIDNLHVDFLIEAVVEDIDVKIKIFNAIIENDQKTIFASNTSSIPITQIAARLRDPSRLIGMHFFNPAHIMKLVEVISGIDTRQEVVTLTMDLAKKMGKVPVRVKDSPGFIVNRVARQYYVESLKILEENISDVEGIDKLLESSGFRMGPFRLMDLIGVDTNFSVTRTLYNQFHQDSKFRPSRIQQQLVDAGHHGQKSGKGFYTYSQKPKQ